MSCSYSDIAMTVYDEKAMDTRPNLSFENVFMMMRLHYGFTAMKMQITICIISTLLMHQVKLALLQKLKMKIALNS